MDVAVEQVTPEKASEWLAFNTHNRHIQEAKVAEYATEMKEGRWQSGSGGFIAFSKENVLLNGQHTLTAQVQADVTLDLVVYRGVEAKAQEVMDIGAKRRFADQIALDGESDPNNMAAATNMLFYWDQGLRGSGLTSMGGSSVKRAQIPVLMEYFRENREEIRAGVTAAAKVRKQVRVSTRILALSHAIFMRIDEGDTEYFFDRLETGESLAKTDPIFQLRKRLNDESQKLSQGRVASQVLLGLIMKAWNLYRDGEQVQILVFRPGGSSKEQFPEPK